MKLHKILLCLTLVLTFSISYSTQIHAARSYSLRGTIDLEDKTINKDTTISLNIIVIDKETQKQIFQKDFRGGISSLFKARIPYQRSANQLVVKIANTTINCTSTRGGHFIIKYYKFKGDNCLTIHPIKNVTCSVSEQCATN